MTTVRIPLPAGTMAVPAARGFTSDTLRSWRVPDQTREMAELVVSELVGNAVEHGGGDAELELSLSDGSIRVDVIDHSLQLPILFSPDPVEDRHRGLLIVSALSTRWGSDLIGDGKTVWAQLPCPGMAGQTPGPMGVDDRSLSG
ncbi:MAG TPA: ATP-binding protein [Pseudonocardiaceae bacterium]|nr:ATP-binding protein [Pseudonocardiaceae bacterium]